MNKYCPCHAHLIKSACWVSLASLALTFTPVVMAQSERTNQAVYSGLWQTTGASRELRRGDFNNLFEAMADSLEGGLTIPVQKVKVEPSDKHGISDTASRMGVYKGAYPGELTRLYCLLNVELCDDSGVPDNIVPGDIVLLPEVAVDEIVQHKPYMKKADQSLESIVSLRGGCQKYDEACQRYLFNLNVFNQQAVDYETQKVKEDFQGELIVPTRTYFARVKIGYEKSDTVINKFLTQSFDSAERGLSRDWQRPVTKGQYQGIELQQRAESDEERFQLLIQAKKKLEPNIIPEATSRAQLETSHNNSIETTDSKNRLEVLKLINHPFARKAEIPDAPDWMHIAILDGWVDKDHCEIDWSAVVDVSNDSQMDSLVADLRTDRITCGEVYPIPAITDVIDHGTHVLSLISASRSSREGPGANPSIHVITNQVTPEDAGLPNRAAKAITSRLQSNTLPLVFNLSWTYPAVSTLNNLDLLGQEIVRPQAPLFVVSAGNQGQEIGPGNCSRFPPCLAGRAPNIINVAALDSSPEDPKLLEWMDLRTHQIKGSNYGPWVHVGAPGENILGAVTGNMVGQLSGTSQAAPLVTAVAGMIWAKLGSPRVPPEIIRDRIVISSDLFLGLPKNIMLGGRLNTDRALELDHAILDYSDGQVAKEIRGKLVNPGIEVYLIEQEDRVMCGMRLRSIMRLHKNPGSSTFEVFIKRDRDDANFLWATDNDEQTKQKCEEIYPAGTLVRRTVFIARQTLSKIITFKNSVTDDVEESLQIEISKVNDYIAEFETS